MINFVSRNRIFSFVPNLKLVFKPIYVTIIALLFSSFVSFTQSFSLFLDGSVEWVNAGNINVTGSNVTLESLVRVPSSSAGNILSKHSTPANINYLLRAQSFQITTSNGHATLTNPMTLQPNITYHLAATYNGSMMRFYVNGCLTAEQPWTGTLITNTFSTAIGQQASCQCEQFTGFLDEVRVWNVARTEAQIRANMYNIANPNFQFNLLAYFKFQNNYTNLALGAPAASAVGATSLIGLPYPYPSALAISHTGSNVICQNTSTGAIDVQASGGIQPYQFSLDGTNFQSNLNFTNLSPGSYTIYVKSNDNCIVTANRTIQNKTAINANLIANDVSCNGDTDGSASVTPNGGNGANYNVSWSNNQTGSASSNLVPGNYSVTIKDSCRVAGNELVTNGHFEQGATGFSSQYNTCTTCLSNIGEELFENQLVVGVNANHHHNGFTGTGQGGAGNFMIVNGSSQSNTNVWCQTINVLPNTYYEFSAWVASVFAQSPAQLQFQANGQLLGPVFNAPGSINTWNQFFSVWNSGANTSVNICIINQNTATAGNDFAIDNISFKACLSCEVVVPFTIDEPEILTATANAQNALCGTNSGSIQVSASGGTPTYMYSVDGINFNNNPNISSLTPGNYTVTVKDAQDCLFTFTANVGDDDVISIEAGLPQIVCAGQSVTLSATGPSGFVWTNNVTDGVPFIPTNTGYYVVSVTLGPTCFAIDSVLVTVNPLPNVLAGLDFTVCDNELVTLNASGANQYTWSNGVQNGVSFNLNAGNYTFTVVGTDGNGCSNTDALDVQVFSTPNVNITANPTSGIAPITVNFQNVNLQGFNYSWNFGIGSNQIINTPTTQYQYSSAGDYWVVVSAEENGCTATDSILITVLDIDFTFEVPNVFSPNEDNVNGLFQLIGLTGEQQLIEFEIIILNRWGNILFKSTAVNFVWDGTDSSGNTVVEGVYFYKMKYLKNDQTGTTIHGFFHLFR